MVSITIITKWFGSLLHSELIAVNKHTGILDMFAAKKISFEIVFACTI